MRGLTSHHCGLGSIPGSGVTCGLSLLLVLILAHSVFFQGPLVFPPPQKPTFLVPNQSQKSRQEEPLNGMSNAKFLFIIYLINGME